MNHYTKLAVIGIRLAALIILILGIIGVFYAVLQVLVSMSIASVGGTLPSCIPYILVGILLYAIANPIGRMVSKGIE